MDNSGFFVIGLIGILLISWYITELRNYQKMQKRIQSQNKWKENIYNFPKHNK